MPILLPQVELNLHSRCQNQIRNWFSREDIRYGDEIAAKDFRQNYPRCIHRPVTPSRQYNCHGMTFAARRTWIEDPTQIHMILKDDDYEKISEESALPGDIVIYSNKGDIEHSGIVVHRDELKVLHILSKWGAAHEVIHRPPECPYSDCDTISYYRIKK